MDGESETTRHGTQALDSALVVLKALAAFPGAVSLGDLARRVGMPASKVHRYLASFVAAGLVRQGRRAGSYDLARGAAEIGLSAIARMDLVDEAGERLPDLVDATGAAGLVAVWGPLGATIVRWRRTGSFVITALGLGTTLPLLNSATGRVFLACLPDTTTHRILDEELTRARALGLRWPDLDPAEPDGVARLRATVLADGHAGVDGRFIPGLNAISAPVLDWQGEAQAVITLTSGDPAILEPRGRALASLTEVCAAISVKIRPETGLAAGQAAKRPASAP